MNFKLSCALHIESTVQTCDRGSSGIPAETHSHETVMNWLTFWIYRKCCSTIQLNSFVCTTMIACLFRPSTLSTEHTRSHQQWKSAKHKRITCRKLIHSRVQGTLSSYTDPSYFLILRYIVCCSIRRNLFCKQRMNDMDARDTSNSPFRCFASRLFSFFESRLQGTVARESFVAIAKERSGRGWAVQRIGNMPNSFASKKIIQISRAIRKWFDFASLEFESLL